MYRLSILALALLASAVAQNFHNDSCGRVTNTGTIRLRSVNAVFRNDAPTAQVTNDGTIEMAAIGNQFTGRQPLGATHESRIGGTVLWSATTNDQRVQGRWYTNLSLSGARKTISDSIFVGSIYSIASGTGTRTYEGTFYYDGTQQQIIVPEKGDNAYRNLVFLDGAVGQLKLIRSDTVTVRGYFLNHASNVGGASVNSRGVLDLRQESRSEAALAAVGPQSAILLTAPTSRLRLANASVLNVDNAGYLIVSSTWKPAALTIDSGSTLRISSTGIAGLFSLLGTAAMDVHGTYINTAPSLVNATYECGTTVRYLGTYPNQQLQATSAEPNHRYGTLETQGGNKRANGDVHIGCGLVVNTGSTPHTIAMGNYTLTVHHSDSTLTPIQFDIALTDCSAGSEIVGRVRHEGLRSSIARGQPLTFNNRFTTVTFDDTTGFPQSITLTVLPSTAPNNFDAATDIQRKITVNYGPSGIVPAWSATVRAGFRLEESRGLTGLVSLSGLRTYNAP